MYELLGVFMGVRRRTFSLQESLDNDLTLIHRKMGIAKSALVNELLAEPVSVLSELVGQLPDVPTSEDMRRLRGESIAVVQERLAASGINLSRENISGIFDSEGFTLDIEEDGK